MTRAETAQHNAAAELAREVASTRDELDRLAVDVEVANTAAQAARSLFYGTAEKLRRLDGSLADALRDVPIEQRLAILRTAGLGGSR